MISSEVVFDIADKEVELKELEKRSSEEGFWSDPEKAKEILKKKAKLKTVVEGMRMPLKIWEFSLKWLVKKMMRRR